MHVAVVSNAAAGHGAAPALYAAHVAPWLRDVVCGDASHIATYTTEPEHGARRIGAQLAHEPPSMLVVLGGDGTLHELLEGLLGARARLAHPVQVVLVPTGTANALYASLYRPTLPAADAADADAWRLRALGARDAAAPAQALTVLRVHAPAAHLACVVTSHALHAAILRDSEALRAEHPGVERFKMAAMQNVATWYRARLTLHAGACGVRVYRPQADAFEDVGDDYERTDAGDVVVDGPFVYMNAMVVERLEPTFVPAPFASGHCRAALRRPHAALDVVVLRPARSPTVRADADADARRAFGEGPLTEVLMRGMYSEGAHVAYVYDAEGRVVHQGPGTPVVEYFRAAGYTWEAHGDEAHTACIDGTIVHAPRVQVHAQGDAGVVVPVPP